MCELPEGWKPIRLRDTGVWLSGGTPSTDEPRFWDGDIPWISAASMKNFYIHDSDRRLTKSGSSAGTRMVGRGSVIFVVRGMSLKKEFRVGVAQRELAFGQDCKAIIPRQDIDGTFLAWALKVRESKILSMVDEAGHGTGRLPTDMISRLEIGIPPMPQQRRIAEILDAIDARIISLTQLSEKQQLQLDGFSRAVIQGQIETGDGSPWREVCLGDILDGDPGAFIQTGPFGSQLHAYEYVNDGIPVVMPQDILGASISEANVARITLRKARELSRHKMVAGDIVFARRGDLQRCALIQEYHQGWLCGTGCLLLRFSGKVVTPEWLALAYQDDFCQRQVLAAAVGSTMVNLNTGILRSLRVPFPPLAVQQRLMAAVHAHRELIDDQFAQISKLRALKQGLAEDLLTGRIRVWEAEAVLEGL